MLSILLAIVCVLLAGALVVCGVLWAQRRRLLAERDEIQAERDSAREQNQQMDKDLAVLRQMHEHDEKRLEDFKKQIDDHLKALTGEALKQTNNQFLQLAEQKLKPLRELIQQYDQHYKQIEQSRKQEYGGLAQVTQSLQEQTAALSKALRRPEVRGRWGEVQLRRIAELAGMTNRCDFEEQLNLDGGESRLRPDMVVRLPNDRTLVVDAKTVLDAFLESVHTDDDEQRKAKRKQHVEQIDQQIKNLSAKSYTEQFSRSPDFVILFLPIESALYAAMEEDDGLLERAMSRNVVIATPTLLIALLKAVEMGWREQRVAENAERIRKLGQELHERLAKALGDVTKVGSSLNSAVKNYNTLVGSLDSRLMPAARRFEQLGTQSAKEMPGSVEPVETSTRPLQAQETAGESAGEQDA
jgi:DNA recombination protein RmuC